MQGILNMTSEKKNSQTKDYLQAPLMVDMYDLIGYVKHTNLAAKILA